MSQVPYLSQYPTVRANNRGDLVMLGDLDPAFQRIEFEDVGNVHYAFHTAHLNNITLGATTSSGHRVSVEDPSFVLILPLTQRVAIEVAGGDCIAGEGDTALVPPGLRRTTVDRGSTTALMRLPLQLLELGSSNDASTPIVMKGDTPVRRAALALLDDISARAERPPARTLSIWEALVVDAFAATLQAGGDQHPTASMRQVRFAEDYIWANLGAPLSVRSVAAHAGVSARALQLAFRRHRGCSPHRYIAMQRIATAHARLLAARPGENVKTIAFDLGIASLGRFARAYRSVYGEAPSNTLARGAGR